MKKVAFYLNNSSLPNQNYCDIVYDNPGLPGSEYEFLLVSQLLDSRKNELEIWLFINFDGKFPHQHVVKIHNLKDCCKICAEENIGTLVVDVKYFDENVMSGFANLNYIVWAHNFMSFKQIDRFYKLPYVKNVVNVGREVMELYRDHPLSWKSTYVYNILPVKERNYYEMKMIEGGRDNHNVAYMGCLVEEKGFHVLAKVWKDILKQVPDAQLFVIGNGRLYDKNAKLGSYGLASPEYEAVFMPYLCDESGCILPSVHFMGILGGEKYDVLSKCKVGVPNPTGHSETFCICGVEMQLCGCTVTTIYHPAFIDTVIEKRWLYKNESDLFHYVIRALNHTPSNFDKIYSIIRDKFGISNVNRWESILNNYDIDKHVESMSQYHYHLKGLKNLLLHLKQYIPLFNKIPLVEKFYNFYYCKTNQRWRKILN